MPRIAVLAMQGDFAEHVQALRKLGVEAMETRLPKDVDSSDGIVIPGGESSTITKLMQEYGLWQAVKRAHGEGKAIWGTCAGMIVVSRNIVGQVEHQDTLGLIGIDVRRNAYGRQVESFEEEINAPIVGEKTFHGIFIRAPVIEKLGEGVQVVARRADQSPVGAQEGKVLVTSFHPELTDDTRFHSYFLKLASGGKGKHQSKE